MAFTHLAEPIPITEQNWPEGTIPLVTTKTITYMHEKYIRECIEGILMQKTTFPVQVLIHDDASTDATADIMREYERKYPKLIQCFYQKENTYGKPNRRDLMKDYHDAVAGKYIAICEGDDYWTDPLKLQKQAEFLEANPDYGLVHTDAEVYNTVSHKRRKHIYLRHWSNYKGGNEFEKILMGHYPIVTCTSMYRSEMSRYFPQGRRFVAGDMIIWLEIAHRSKIKFFSDSTSVRQILEESATRSKSWDKMLAFRMGSYELMKHFIEKYGCSDECRRQTAHTYYKQFLFMAFMAGNKAEAKKAYMRIKGISMLSIQDKLCFLGSKASFLKCICYPLIIVANKLTNAKQRMLVRKKMVSNLHKL